MRVESVYLPEIATNNYNLKPVKMERLKQVVLIAGKNGAGKSRLLDMLNFNIQNTPNEGQLDEYRKNIESKNHNIEVYIQRNNSIRAQIDGNFNQSQIDIFNEAIQKNDKLILREQQDINNIERQASLGNYLKFFPYKENTAVVDFVPKALNLTDSYLISPQSLDQNARYIYTMGTANISLGTIPAIEQILRSWVNINTTTTEDLNVTQDEITRINANYEKLKKYIKLFLNTDLKRTRDGYPELFNKRIGEARLSNGQIILLQFCMALFAQEENLENLIIFMDEPENHLHPAALIEVLDKITPHIKNGQVWIATHSINVLAHFDPSNIWYIENGEISYAGNVPQKVLKGLLGNDEEIIKLSNFLSLPSYMASEKFAFESLFYPQVLVTGPEDHQLTQIHEIIKRRVNAGEKLKVLDFGIGKGRLISTISENERLREEDVTDWLDYFGYDKFDTYKAFSISRLESIYSNSENRYFNDASTLLSNHEEKTFDYIVMCNVFHEIEPSDWLNLFNSVTSPFKLLKDDGYLLIIEDQFLAVGEKAHSKGFLVFDELEFKKLFKITSNDKYQSTDYRKDGRLKSHHIPKNCIARISTDSKKEALEVLLQNSKDEIKKLRNGNDTSFKKGKLHGFWTQQLANASLALEEI